MLKGSTELKFSSLDSVGSASASKAEIAAPKTTAPQTAIPWVTGEELLDHPTDAELVGIALAIKANFADNSQIGSSHKTEHLRAERWELSATHTTRLN